MGYSEQDEDTSPPSRSLSVDRVLTAAALIGVVLMFAYYAAWFAWHPHWMQDQWADRCHARSGHVVEGGRNGNDLCVLNDGRVVSWRTAN